ncbi:hypothetical protein NC653_009069 [Populus alba x Populus x berolinensis]|uniref:Uncharacterized protein n=1 Tax=Populus alba x Populus x berolinensis TaxID=444605 RepID=A0AAD6R8F1_9ROSI|nr:hypothetical protein NC653_009069 [Populus alba x Populus x berolinensis]
MLTSLIGLRIYYESLFSTGFVVFLACNRYSSQVLALMSYGHDS